MKLKVNSNFFGIWSKDMAYVLGVVLTDGCLVEHKNGHHCMNITSKDLNLLKGIKRIMRAEHKISRKERGFCLQIRNRSIYSDLLKLGLTPRKSKSVRFIDTPQEYLSNFIRGCFDGDGGVTIWKEPRWKNTWQIRTTFASGSRDFLEKLHFSLISQDVLKKGKIWYSGRAYELHFGIKDSLRFYHYIYSDGTRLFLKRKRDAFEKFVTLRNTKN